MLNRLWAFVRDKKNREIVSWFGGGATVVAAATWTMFIYFHDDKKPGASTITVTNPSGTMIAPGATFNGPVNVGPDQKQLGDKIDKVAVLVQQLLTVSPAQASPGRERAV